MPKTWLYYIALCMPLLLRVLLLDTSFMSWLWYHDYKDSYYALSALSVNPSFVQFIGGWALPCFVITVMSFWLLESFHDDEDTLMHQFLLVPLMYIPFTIITDFIVTLNFNPMNLFAHPVVIVPFGYIYIGIWLVFIKTMHHFRLVV
jgi:hypothetical protein